MQCYSFQDGDLSQLHKKRKMNDGLENNQENIPDLCNNIHSIPERTFLHILKKDCESIYQTEDWQVTGSSIFLPLTEDIMVNTRNVEQFSCTNGNFSVAGPDGYYSKTLFGHILHLWRYCSNSNRLFISRSFLFKNFQIMGEMLFYGMLTGCKMVGNAIFIQVMDRIYYTKHNSRRNLFKCLYKSQGITNREM